MEGQFYHLHGFNSLLNSDSMDFDDIIQGYLEDYSQPSQQDKKEPIYRTSDGSLDQEKPTYKTKIQESLGAERSPLTIEISGEKQREVCMKTKTGHGQETINLNKYFHAEICRFLRSKQLCRVLSTEECKLFKEYQAANPSFQAHKQLTNNPSLKALVLEHVSSSAFIESLLSSSKMQFCKKISTLRFFDRFEQCIQNGETQTWRR